MENLSEKQYRSDFRHRESVPDDSVRREALEHALDIRKFEIDMYWRRASYFWTFIGATFVSFGVVQQLKEPQRTDLSLIVTCLGLVFSVAWYCVNRGSKRWHSNWEYHVDLLEDPVVGPLYKTVITKPKPVGIRRNIQHFLVGPAALSVTKINQLVSIFVVILWAILVVYSLPPFDAEAGPNWYYIALLLLTIGAILVIPIVGTTTIADSCGEATKRGARIKAPEEVFKDVQ